MKKALFLTGVLFLAVAATFAQSNKEEIELYQSVFGLEKKALVNEFVKLEGEAATAFWALYDEYETARKEGGQKRIALISKYSESYLDLDDETTDALVVESIKLKAAQAKLIKKYYNSIKKASGVKAAAQFYQLEGFFISIVNVALLEEMPIIGEFDL